MAKVRVYYVGKNRNNSYISPEFSEEFAKTAYNKPVVGTYDVITKDFKGHESPKQAKAYGFIIPDSLAWKYNLDPDGVIRRYATYSVLLWAEYWEEAKKIIGKSQSMELNRDSIVGYWTDYLDSENGINEVYVYTSASIKGICILGDDREPCYEGASFFEKDESYSNFIKAVEKFNKIGGFDKMDNTITNLEEEFAAAKKRCNELEDENKQLNEKYTQAAEELNILKEQFDTLTTSFNDLTSRNEELQNNYEALTATHTELQNNYETLQQSFEEIKNKYETIQVENSDLKIKNQNYENQDKQRLMDKFRNLLPNEVFSEIESKISDFSYPELQTKLSLEYTSFSLSKNTNEDTVRVPNHFNLEGESELTKLLKNYRI